jgi:hypothetical protein
MLFYKLSDWVRARRRYDGMFVTATRLHKGLWVCFNQEIIWVVRNIRRGYTGQKLIVTHWQTGHRYRVTLARLQQMLIEKGYCS